MEYRNQDLQGKSFNSQDLSHADFSGSDLRGADFSNANLKNANFSGVKTGIQKHHSILVFLFAILISLLSGYIAMLTGDTIHSQIQSEDPNEVIVGYITLGYFVIFIGISIWIGLFKAIKRVLVFMILLTAVLGLISFISGYGTGLGALKSLLALVLIGLMFVAGTISRAVAGTFASGILFLIVAMAGAMFGKSLGGGYGTVVAALACAVISKRAISQKFRHSKVKNIALFIGTYFGTSFKKSDLTNADFSGADLKNTDFSDSNRQGVSWDNAKKVFCRDEEE
ncbi:MAG: pentapeptide repeat-containing protein [Algoriphagus sp.]|nr:pentapeptide repeat-containing protein [Algoriphagus sp.]